MEKRMNEAKTIEVVLREAIGVTGLSMDGFQYPLVGELYYQIEVRCESPKQLQEVYNIVQLFCESRKMKIKTANVNIIPDWLESVIVIIPYGSKA